MSGGKLPEGWINTTIGDISVKCSQRVPDENEQFIYVDIGSINRELKVIENPQYLIGKDAPSRARKEIKAHDIIVSLTRPNLNAVALVSEKYDEQIASTGFEVIRPTLVESRYIFALVRSRHFIDSISGLVQGALYPAAKSSDVQSYKFPLPPLAEQKIITEKLDTLLAQVVSTKARLECAFNKIEMFKRAVMDFAVKGDLTKEWRNKNEINEWEITQWENILLDKKDSFRRGPFGGALKKDIFVESGYKVYEQYCPINDDCSFSRYYITEEKFHEMSKFEVHSGDFLISGAGSIGKITLVPEGCEKGIINQALLRVRINNEIYDKKFFLTLFRSPMFQKVIIENSTGSAMQNLKSVKELKQIPVPLPCLSEQHEIVRRVEQLFAYADTIEKQVNNALTRINNLTQSILAKAFRGELTAQWRAENPSLISGENSAAALLEKIKAERAASGGKKTSRKKA
ncbi:TPA: restriction endonuclease subunit S [Klebsiella aerogenes]|uniref:restriction endonuclease subunit S n=1 Tax=Klebsiella aerogenes TaxID=548 RepID=UPI002A38A162|nr:restriction endonuclease subunit S [Klebsiella aerogenes]HBQ7841788.1 restriction endonuclease subunit S [Klebsiella aerogenes]HBS5698925.1 restriction endonuclease subunit S [Klebsiella aerogenes]